MTKGESNLQNLFFFIIISRTGVFMASFLRLFLLQLLTIFGWYVETIIAMGQTKLSTATPSITYVAHSESKPEYKYCIHGLYYKK